MSRSDYHLPRRAAPHDDAECRESLELVLRSLPADVRTPFVAGLLTAARCDEELLAELWRVDGADDGKLRGAVWGQLRPGAIAIVWPPQWRDQHRPPSPDPLPAALLQSLAARGTTMAQSLLADRDSAEAAALAGCGFTHLAELTYLAAAATPNPPGLDDSITFAPIADDDFARLADLVEQTYVDTLDCPSLNGLRRTADVLDEYRAIGDRGTELWRWVCREGREVGCLLLADHGKLDQVELVYMGIVPEARGRGLGAATVGEALRRTAQIGRSRVVLAVDAANRPALEVYRRGGFTSWETRSVFVKRLSAMG